MDKRNEWNCKSFLNGIKEKKKQLDVLIQQQKQYKNKNKYQQVEHKELL